MMSEWRYSLGYKFFTVCITAFLLFPFTKTYAIEKIQVGYHVVVPKSLTRVEGEWQGLYKDKFNCVFEQLNFEIEYIQYPVKRMEKMLVHHKLDLGVLLAKTDRRDLELTFLGPILVQPYLLISNSRFPEPKTDWKNWRLGTVYGTNFHQLIEQKTKATIEPTENWEAATRMLLRGRTDGLIVAREIIGKNIPSNLLGNLSITEIPWFTPMQIGLYASGRLTERTAEYNQVRQAVYRCKVN